MSTIADLSGKKVAGQNTNQFLGQSSTSNPLLELAQGIMGNAATAQGRGDMAFGGGAGVPSMQRGNIKWGGFKNVAPSPGGDFFSPGPANTGTGGVPTGTSMPGLLEGPPDGGTPGDGLRHPVPTGTPAPGGPTPIGPPKPSGGSSSGVDPDVLRSLIAGGNQAA